MALLDAWEADWNGTSAGLGLTNVDERIVQFTAGTYGDLNLVGRDFSAHQRVTIRGSGAFSRDAIAPTSGVKFVDLAFKTCNNIRLIGLQFVGSYRHEVENATNCDLLRCIFENDKVTTPEGLATTTAEWHVIMVKNTEGLTIADCVFIGGKIASLTMTQSHNNLTLDNLFFAQMQGDCIRWEDMTMTNVTCNALHFTAAARNPGTKHRDGLQIRTGTITDVGFTNCLTLRKDHTGTGPGDENTNVLQGIYVEGTASCVRVTYNQCFFSNGNHAIKGAQGPSSEATYCSAYAAESTTPGADYLGIYTADFDYNICTSKSVANEVGQGPNGIEIICPSGSTSGGWENQHEYVTSPLTKDHAILAIKPPSGKRVHWDHINPVGPHLLLRGYFDVDNADHPALRGWPSAAMFHIQNGTAGMALTSGTYETFNASSGAYTG
jgi:hypothetical protein